MGNVAAIVVTHESEAFLPACLDSLSEHSGDLDLTVVVADAGSTDGVESLCRERGALFLGGPNRGFGATVNRALSHPAVREARYLLVMNPDVEIADGSLAEFVALCDSRPGCGVFAPRQVDQHGELVYSIGREPSPAVFWEAWRTGWPGWVWDPEVYEREARCEWVMGSAMFVRSEMFDSLGGFDERFFLFSEEVDLCTQARQAGWEIAYLPQLTVRHWKADRPLDPYRERMITWSELLYMRKWYGLRDRLSMRIALTARLGRQLARQLRHHRPSGLQRARFGAVLRFRRRRYGPAKRPVIRGRGPRSAGSR